MPEAYVQRFYEAKTEVWHEKRQISPRKARPHVAQSVKTFLNDQKVTIMEHPPYSPDLALSDFWLFDYVKNQLDDHTDAQSLKGQITEILKNTPHS